MDCSQSRLTRNGREQQCLRQRSSAKTLSQNALKGHPVTRSRRKLFATVGARATLAGWIQNQVGGRSRWSASVLTLLITCQGMFTNLCTVHADTSQVSKTLSPRRGFAGLQFYRQQFSIVLKFGLTELEAQISWMEDGEERK